MFQCWLLLLLLLLLLLVVVVAVAVVAVVVAALFTDMVDLAFVSTMIFHMYDTLLRFTIRIQNGHLEILKYCMLNP